MVKHDLLKKITDKESEFTMKEVERILNAYSEVVIENGTKEGEKIPLFGLGNFVVKKVPARSGKSAINGKEWSKPEHLERAFKVTKSVKEIG